MATAMRSRFGSGSLIRTSTERISAAMSAQMEIVWARWNRVNNAWSLPAALSANSVLDHAPLICGPMSDGSLLASWTRNGSNLLMGTNDAGSDVFWVQWNPAAQSWSAPQTLITNPGAPAIPVAGRRDQPGGLPLVAGPRWKPGGDQ